MQTLKNSFNKLRRGLLYGIDEGTKSKKTTMVRVFRGDCEKKKENEMNKLRKSGNTVSSGRAQKAAIEMLRLETSWSVGGWMSSAAMFVVCACVSCAYVFSRAACESWYAFAREQDRLSLSFPPHTLSFHLSVPSFLLLLLRCVIFGVTEPKTRSFFARPATATQPLK